MKRWLLAFMLGMFVVSFVLDLLVREPAYGKFWWDKIYGFDLVFGLVGCIAIVWVSKALGKYWVQRGEQYYDKR